MRVAGRRRVDAAPQRVWDGLADPDTLARALPDAQAVERHDTGGIRATLGWRVAATDGTYRVDVRPLETQAPHRCVQELRAEGGPGTLGGTVRVTLDADGDATSLAWEADVAATGRLAATGGRVLEAAVRRHAEAFLDAAAGELTGARPPPARDAGEQPAAPERASTPASDWLRAEQGPPAPGAVQLLLAAAAGALAVLLGSWLVRRLAARR